MVTDLVCNCTGENKFKCIFLPTCAFPQPLCFVFLRLTEFFGRSAMRQKRINIKIHLINKLSDDSLR